MELIENSMMIFKTEAPEVANAYTELFRLLPPYVGWMRN
jgi:hypothetical protein